MENPSISEEMYDNATEERLVMLAESEGISIELVDSDERTYWLTPGVTGWDFDKLQSWVADVIEGMGRSRDYGVTRLPEGPLEVEVYDEMVDW